MKANSYIYYGTKCTSEEVLFFLQHTLESNQQLEKNGKRKVPVCIWGEHGIGKTQLVEDFAKDNGYSYAYIAPAQFEEMGDLLGMPKISEQSTVFVPPEWVPTSEGPGILLIDDVNRADDRILRGIMQLLQNYELVSWRLPKDWHIVLTANPDGGDYSVTPMDFAMLTRIMHITLKFDVKAWSKWAQANEIDTRGINFVLTYPEVVTGERTTPRTLVQFFESIHSLEDLKKNLNLVKLLADSCLDQNTVSSFISFVNSGLSKLVTPEEILNSDDFIQEILPQIRRLVEQKTKRVDILSVITTRLVNYLLVLQQKLSHKELQNLKAFLKMELLPNDMRLITAQELVTSKKKNIQNIFSDPELGSLLAQKM
ncbi:MAG: AAA family ATPase [Spirochaetota bacterium]